MPLILPTLEDAEVRLKDAQKHFASIQEPLLAQAHDSLADDTFLNGVKVARDALPEGHAVRNALHNVVTSIEVHRHTIRHHIVENEAMLNS